MAEDTERPLRRSSSQASHVSANGDRVRTVRVRPKKSLTNTQSTPTHGKDPSLTSFPSLSPEDTGKAAGPQPSALPDIDTPGRTTSQRVRDRKATLAGLTNASPSLQGRGSLFDDSPRSSVDIPGALHLATDDHIERLIARTGAVKLVRQFAQDLAHRDAELSALRNRTDERERELKKMLREVEVSSIDIERRLHHLDNSVLNVDAGPGGRQVPSRSLTNSLDDMMHQAMQEEVGESSDQTLAAIEDLDLGSTIKPARNDRDGASSVTSRKRTGSIKSWQNYIWGSTATSRKTSRSSSIVSTDVPDDPEATAKARNPSTATSRRKGLENLFSPQQQASGNSYFIGGSMKKPMKKGPQADTASIASRKSERSISSWTVKLFAGNPQAGKDNDGPDSRARSSSMDQPSHPPAGRLATGSSALAALSKVHSNPGAAGSVRSNNPAKANPPPLKNRYPSSGNLAASPDTMRTDTNVANLGPVEMDAILPDETKPPTMNSTYNHFSQPDMLTDRFGFIYDQRQRKRQREAALAITEADRKDAADTSKGSRLGHESDNKGHERKGSTSTSMVFPWQRPATPTSIDDASSENVPSKGWQDYLRITNLITSRPTELLSHTPSAGAIVTLTVADGTTAASANRSRASSISANAKNGASEPSTPEVSPVVAGNLDDSSNNGPDASVNGPQGGDQEPVKLLLEQLTEVHDQLQSERAVKWNQFLRKVRVERGAAAAAASDRQNAKGKKTANMPEASLLDGEIVGVTDLGNKGKIGRAKWKEFKILVLGGVPVSLRSKIWPECSGASALRIPGYYDDLVAASSSTDQSEDDAEVTAQIQADIHRTLTDNVFFRHGPGTIKLREVLLAYARRNPTVGYCQGMNMIAGSLLLIMPTAEDAFWILVAMIENILPAHYYDHGLVTSRADQIVLREYVTEVLPRLSSHLEELGVELEAMTFQWFLSVFTDCLSAEALYRVWDVVLCLNSTSSASPSSPTPGDNPNNKVDSTKEDETAGTGSTFLFQLALALLKLNESQLLACDNPASVYGYINHNMTNHAISIDGLIQASEGLRKVVIRDDVLEKRGKAIEGMTRR